MTGTGTGRCSSTAPHPAHRWALGRQVVLCPGVPEPVLDPDRYQDAVALAMEHVLVEGYGSKQALASGFHATIDQILQFLPLVLRHLPSGKAPTLGELERLVAGVVDDAYREYLASLDVHSLYARLAAANRAEEVKQQLQQLLGDDRW